ncbi:MAG: DUF4932 domain-containing protein [Treponema sp.]|nr:DUF4932 domain-containing protein [Treponema sp.]
MQICIDQRIELITVIQTLCNYWDDLAKRFFNQELFQCKYKENVNLYFNKYKHHETVDLFNKLSNEEIDISAFLTLLLNYTDPSELNKNTNYNNIKYEIFIDSIKNFYKETQFDWFFDNNKVEYDKIINDFGNKEILLNEINFIFEYLSIERKNYEIIISPLVFGNFGISTNIKNYIIISPLGYKDTRYIFNLKESIRVSRHEIAHTVINDLTKKYFDQSKYKNVKTPEKFVNNLYNNLETIINEYIIRSITYSLEKDNNWAKSLLDHEIKNGFEKVEDIKNYILENCTENNKLIKDNKYKELIDYIVSKICE